MTTSLRLIVAAFVACGLLWAAPAEARFGKASTPSKQSKKTDKKGSTKAAAAKRTHSASAVRAAPRAQPSYEPCCTHHATPVYTRERTYIAGGGAHVHSHHDREAQGPSLQRFELFGTAQPAIGAGILGAGMLVDWSDWGMDLRYDHLVFLPEDVGGEVDTIGLFDVSLTRRVIGNERARLRWHLGLASAFAPDATFVAPYGGLSFSATVVGPLTAEASAQLALYPFTKLDTRAGLGLRLGFVEVRGGMRLLTLNDQGRVDGVSNTELFLGPYLAAGIVI